jgi:hypothetical protein
MQDWSILCLGNWTRIKKFVKLLDPAPDPDTRKMKADSQHGISTPNLSRINEDKNLINVQ